MKLTDLSIEQQQDPHELAAFFANNPTALFEYETCQQLAEWLEEREHPSVKYALSGLKSLDNPKDMADADLSTAYFIYNESSFDFNRLPKWLSDADNDEFRAYLSKEKLEITIGKRETFWGCMNAIQHHDKTKEKLHPILFNLYQKSLALTDTQQEYNKEAYSQANLARKYWKEQIEADPSHKNVYKYLAKAFASIPTLPVEKKRIPISSELAPSMIKSVFFKGVKQGLDKSTQCDLGVNQSTQTSTIEEQGIQADLDKGIVSPAP